MATTSSDGACEFTEAGIFTTVAIGPKRTVTYHIDTSASKADLALRYRIIVNGRVLPTNGDKPAALTAANRKIMVAVDSGSKVGLYLNSDVHPDFRRSPVYTVLVGTSDVEVFITEKLGRGERNLCGSVGAPSQRRTAAGAVVDVYRAFLTGDTWALISNCYSADEADAMLPADCTPTIRAAVLEIYTGLRALELVVRFPASEGQPRHTMRVRFDAAQNVQENTTRLNQLSDVLCRAHPRAYAALLAEAYAVGITEMRVTSGWRPMLGSIAHRAGLGLDINYAESGTTRVYINRAALTNTRLQPTENVSARERTLYVEYEQAKAEDARAQQELKLAERLQSTNFDNKNDIEHAADNLREAHARNVLTNGKLMATKRAWGAERDRNESSLISALRGKLHRNASIDQVLDPWYIDINTRSSAPPMPNEQLNANEKTHNNHLHITVGEPKIL